MRLAPARHGPLQQRVVAQLQCIGQVLVAPLLHPLRLQVVDGLQLAFGLVAVVQMALLVTAHGAPGRQCKGAHRHQCQCPVGMATNKGAPEGNQGCSAAHAIKGLTGITGRAMYTGWTGQ